MALFGNGGIDGPIRMQEARFEVERGAGEDTTDDGKIKRDCLATGTSFLSVCLHIVFWSRAADPARCAGAGYAIFLCFQCRFVWRPQCAPHGDSAVSTLSKYFYATALRRPFSTLCRRFDLPIVRHGDRRRRFPHPSRPGPRPRRRRTGGRSRPRRPAFIAEVHQAIRRAGGNPNRLAVGREGKRPVQCARPGRRGRRDA